MVPNSPKPSITFSFQSKPVARTCAAFFPLEILGRVTQALWFNLNFAVNQFFQAAIRRLLWKNSIGILTSSRGQVCTE
jgi:hypothetical protein